MKRVFAISLISGFALSGLVLFFQNCGGSAGSGGLTDSNNGAATVTAAPIIALQYNAPTGQQVSQAVSVGAPPTVTTVNGISPAGIASAQFNSGAGGHVDLILSGDHGVILASGNGDGTFNVTGRAPLAITGLGSAGALATGDFDFQTGAQDLAVVDTQNNELVIVDGNGDGSFDLRDSYSVSIAPGGNSIFPFDLNGDGFLDAAVLSPGIGQLSTMLSAFDPKAQTLSYGSEIYSLGTTTAMALGDVNNDGLIDLVTYDGSGSLNIYISSQSGYSNAPLTVTVPFIGGTKIMQILIGDLDGDGLNDVVAYTDSYSPAPLTYNYDAHYFKNTGNGNLTYVRSETFSTGAQLFFTGGTVQDLNGDGHNDIALVTSSNSSFTNTSAISLKACSQTQIPFVFNCGDVAAQATAQTQASGFTVGDFNGDGIQDIAVSSSRDTAAGTNSFYVFLGKP